MTENVCGWWLRLISYSQVMFRSLTPSSHHMPMTRLTLKPVFMTQPYNLHSGSIPDDTFSVRHKNAEQQILTHDWI